jgi:hypothetical protein
VFDSMMAPTSAPASNTTPAEPIDSYPIAIASRWVPRSVASEIVTSITGRAGRSVGM